MKIKHQFLKKCETKKTTNKSNDDTWSSHLLDMNDYGLKNYKGL